MENKKTVEVGQGAYRSTSIEVQPPDTWWQTQVKSWKLYKEDERLFWNEYTYKNKHRRIGRCVRAIVSVRATWLRLKWILLFIAVIIAIAFTGIKSSNEAERAQRENVVRKAKEFAAARPQENLKVESCFRHAEPENAYTCRLSNTSTDKFRFLHFTTNGELQKVE